MDNNCKNEGRRDFLKKSTAIAVLTAATPILLKAAENDETIAAYFEKVPLELEINGQLHKLSVEPRLTLLDLLREQLADGKRINSCLSLAVTNHGKKITTIEGLAKGEQLHPMQEAFMKHDGFQCGYCTPGQIMSAIGCIREGHADTAENVREYMSGNICRCGAYPNIVDAIMEVKKGGKPV